MLRILKNKIGKLLCTGDTGKVNEIQNLVEENEILKSRLDDLEHRLINYYRNRWDAIDCVADYLVNAEIIGDYAEFGVFKGSTFGYACKVLGPLFPEMRFLAFDSFEGLPEPNGIDRDDEDFTSGFFKGQFYCSKSDFLQNVLKSSSISKKRVVTKKGWFDETLQEKTYHEMSMITLSAIWIDCDLYESTVPILEFITPLLKVGTVILFDDWRCFRNLPDYGQQRACREWLESNTNIVLNDFISFGFHGKSFTVGRL